MLTWLMREPGRIDPGTLNLLAEHATRLAEHATRLAERAALVLDSLPPDVENVIEKVGWRRLPGIEQCAPVG
ncbi:hypothetical protein ACFQU9_18075 [Actinomadura namibiensis]|uniref:Uncharacterized protein n=1 Tax=Actinomadura namibiensis TaxID=182080 RepID=A0A7W3LXM3_ACTNM|nr:hypothetical protein [Actinomadura namibiensis]MBA8956209.1 hypothetical protein [Actinomadura namibiensis]